MIPPPNRRDGAAPKGVSHNGTCPGFLPLHRPVDALQQLDRVL
jgi:hypothetical protein